MLTQVGAISWEKAKGEVYAIQREFISSKVELTDVKTEIIHVEK